jgi:hypothetical protein
MATMLSATAYVSAEESANERQAKRIFNHAYELVFGEQGATLHYDVNITGIYKTSGTIWYKGKKSKFEDAKMNSWNDGVTVYTVKRKKKNEVEIHSARNNKSDKYSSKFKFVPENFNYSIANHEEGLMLTLKAKKGVKGIKEARVLLDHHTHYPINVRVRVGIFRTTIKISNFKVGGITDDFFTFPQAQYKDYKYVDKRQ